MSFCVPVYGPTDVSIHLLVDNFLRKILTFFFFNDTATTEIYTLSLHDALPICLVVQAHADELAGVGDDGQRLGLRRSEEHTSELQSLRHLVCRLLLENKKVYIQTTGHVRALNFMHRQPTRSVISNYRGRLRTWR